MQHHRGCGIRRSPAQRTVHARKGRHKNGAESCWTAGCSGIEWPPFTALVSSVGPFFASAAAAWEGRCGLCGELQLRVVPGAYIGGVAPGKGETLMTLRIAKKMSFSARGTRAASSPWPWDNGWLDTPPRPQDPEAGAGVGDIARITREGEIRPLWDGKKTNGNSPV